MKSLGDGLILQFLSKLSLILLQNDHSMRFMSKILFPDSSNVLKMKTLSPQGSPEYIQEPIVTLLPGFSIFDVELGFALLMRKSKWIWRVLLPLLSVENTLIYWTTLAPKDALWVIKNMATTPKMMYCDDRIRRYSSGWGWYNLPSMMVQPIVCRKDWTKMMRPVQRCKKLKCCCVESQREGFFKIIDIQ